MLNNASGAEVTFSTGDRLQIGLRNRVAESESGNCSRPGQFINLSSGEAWKAPYEATPEETSKFGESKTKGALPASYDKELVKYIIKNNRIVDIIGNGRKAEEMRVFFTENDTRRNIDC
jgi:leucyl aminopeptidase (aminopeptidase T)